MSFKQYIDLKEKHKKFLLSFGLQGIQVLSFFILAFVFFYFRCSFSWSIFSERDISRAVGWLEGNFYWPGPEMSSGNNLPGPFFYFLLFPAILIGENTYSQVALWTITWFALTYTLAFFFISKITSHKESLLIFLITFISCKIPVSSDILNPEFAIIFHILALMGLYYWREKRNSAYLYLTGLVIALGIQTHLLVALHALTALLFYVIDKSERKKIKALLLFLLITLSPLLIYSLLNSFHVFETSYMESAPHIIFLLEYIFSEKWLIYANHFIIPFLPFFAFCAIFILWQKKKTKKWILKASTKNLLIITVIPFLSTFFSAEHFWYLLFIPILSIILISKCIDDILPKNLAKKINFLMIYIGFTLTYAFSYTLAYILIFKHKIAFFFNPFNLFFIENKFALYIFFLVFFIMAWTNFQWRNKTKYKSILLGLCLSAIAQMGAFYTFYSPEFSSIDWPIYQKLHPLMKRIYLETGWTPKTAMKKIIMIGIHPERSLPADYNKAVETLKINSPPPLLLSDGALKTNIKQNYFKQKKYSKGKPTGYFIILNSPKIIGHKHKNWSSYLSQSSLLSPILKQEIKKQKIIIQEPQLFSPYWLIPYKTTKNSLFPDGFHNIGQPYYWEEPDWLKNCHQTQSFKNEKGFFYCRVFPGYLQKAGLSISFFEKNSLFLDIQFFGPLLASPTLSVNLDGIAEWSDIQIHLDCNKKSFHRSLPIIGRHHNLDISTIEFSKKQAKILLAPLKIQIPLRDCKKDDIEKIKLTFIEKHTERGYIEREQKKEQVVWEMN